MEEIKIIFMKVVCIDNIESLYITKGKIYDVYSERGDFYQIKNDKTFIGLFRKEHFEDIRKIREEKLKKLGI